jgi:hypothetical protein
VLFDILSFTIVIPAVFVATTYKCTGRNYRGLYDLILLFDSFIIRADRSMSSSGGEQRAAMIKRKLWGRVPLVVNPEIGWEERGRGDCTTKYKFKNQKKEK